MLKSFVQNLTTKKKVFVGLSGGVDSAVSALLLKQQGYDVTGVFIKTWTPDYIECTQKQDRLDAIRVCSLLDIPFIDLDLKREYKLQVIDYFLNEYNNNRIPNPDIMCNKYIKFDAFYKYALNNNAIIATGHYAKIEKMSYSKNKDQTYFLTEPKDKNKDQTYFLYQIKKQILENIIFPLSNLTKDQVRQIALDNNIPVAAKKDSQGICMLGGDISVKDFLIKELDPKKGIVKDENGNIIGNHDGVILYTIGERRGFKTSNNYNDCPYYVIKKDYVNNTLIVSNNKEYLQNYKSISKDDQIHLEEVNLFTDNINLEDKIFVQWRYRGLKVACFFDIYNNIIILDKESIKYKDNFVSGQSAVLYDVNNVCLGGGVIKVNFL